MSQRSRSNSRFIFLLCPICYASRRTQKGEAAMARAIYLLFGFLAYLIFFLTFLYLIAFVGNLPWVEVTVDRGGPAGPLTLALIVNVALIALFGVQHSVMARAGFKRAWTRIVPEPIERSTYVLLASLALIILFLFWRPIPAPVWSVGNEIGAMILWALFGAGWLIVLLSTFLLSHFELFGLHQVWSHARGSELPPPQFRQPLFYKWVRHPLYAGFFLAFWATPQMSMGHLLLALGMSVYMLIAIRHEERDMIRLFGDQYVEYRSKVGMLVPGLGRRST
jgi:protein-S-isoprenylcysteine O-methyltransferase Ste14